MSFGSKIDTGEWAYNLGEVGTRLWDTAKESALTFGLTNIPSTVHNVSTQNHNRLIAAGEANIMAGKLPTAEQLAAMNMSEAEVLGKMAVLQMDGTIIADGSHLVDGQLKPSVTYETGEHEYVYQTNDEGLIDNVHVENLQFKIHDGRLKHNPNTYGKLEGDHAGHLIGDQFGGSPELDNLVSQAKYVNKNEYYSIESQWAVALRRGQKVSVDISINYSDGEVRPDSFDIAYRIDGESFSQHITNH